MARVLVQYGEGQKIARLLKCTPKAVCDALAGRTNSKLARSIRKMAIARGGVAVNKTLQK